MSWSVRGTCQCERWGHSPASTTTGLAPSRKRSSWAGVTTALSDAVAVVAQELSWQGTER